MVYKVSGNGRSASVSYSDSGGANDAQVSVPYQISVRLPSGAFFSVVAEGVGGTTIGCEVVVDGKTIMKRTATTASAIADCHGATP
ncbi:MAG: MmpS family transport accessory protein [Ilumatobacteraceae bacterium]